MDAKTKNSLCWKVLKKYAEEQDDTYLKEVIRLTEENVREVVKAKKLE